jgi:tetratricopeptide (TPR) repeat protein
VAGSIAAGCLLAACGGGALEADATSGTTASAPPSAAPVAEAALEDAPADAGTSAAAQPVTLDRSGGYLSGLVSAAMRGISYEGGALAIDTEAARTLVEGPDAAASARALEEGRRLIAINHREDAIAAMTRAVLLDPTSADALEGLGQALTVRRKYPQAAAAFRAALEQAPGSAALHVELADIQVRLNDREAAVAGLRRALELDPDHARARERLALQLYFTGRPDAAWDQVHASEARGHAVPPQFRVLLAQAHPEPAGAPAPAPVPVPTHRGEER